MSNDQIIFFDSDTGNDGMLLLGWSTSSNDDDFLWWMGLTKKNKIESKQLSVNEIDETIIRKNDDDNDSISNNNDVSNTRGSVDALVVKRAEKWDKDAISSNHNRLPRSWSSRFSLSDRNKISFEQGKISKKRLPSQTEDVPLKWTWFEYETKLTSQDVMPSPSNNQSSHSWPSLTSLPKSNLNATVINPGWSASREDRRKNATGQAVTFNRWGGGQKVWFTHNNRAHTHYKKSTQSDYKVSQTISKKEEILMGDTITVKEFAEKMGVPIAEVIKKFIANKMLLSLNSTIDFETATLIAMEFDIKTIKESASAGLEDLIEGNIQSILEVDKWSDSKEERPPIVTIMGHVDHGKTTLLDYLRKTTISSKEHGGITQSIGWSQIVYNGKKVTFIDTPGHALFTSLRARWSKITDIVIIVIAADDGIMKQTVEAINHAKDAKVPIIVAITKIDKWVDNSEFIKTQLSEHGLIIEEWWWDVPMVRVSSKTGEWIDDLMDQILLHAEVSELVCDPERPGIWVVLEAHKDIQKGIMTNMIVMTGTIKVWDVLWIYHTFGKIKKLYNRKGHEIKSAHGWDPVMVLGINEVPEAGKLAESVKDEKIAKEKIQIVNETRSQWWFTGLLNKIAEGETTQVNLIIKADSRWSLEALKEAINQIELPENIHFKTIHNDIGNFFDSDLDLAKAANALLIWFGTSVSTIIKAKIDQMGITLKAFNVIYEITDYLEALAKGLIKKDPVEVAIGKLQVLWVFYRKGNETIFGGKVTEGEIRNGSYFRIIRGEEIVDSGKVTSLQKGQENVDKIAVGYECGMKAKVSKKIELNDLLEYYVME